MKKIDFNKFLEKIEIVVVDELPDFNNFQSIRKQHDEAKAYFERVGIPDFVKNAGKENNEKSIELP